MIDPRHAQSKGIVRLLRYAKHASAFAIAICFLIHGGTLAHASQIASWWPLPPISPPQADRPYEPNILGTVAITIRTRPTSTRWSKLMTAPIYQTALANLTEQAQGLSREDQLAFIQAAVNHSIRTGPASYNCSDDGYWAPASETLARGMGDCIDVAITKMEALRFLGFADSDLYLTTGRFHTSHGVDGDRETAALLVRIGEHFWLMSEQSGQIIDAGLSEDEVTRFTPIVTYGVGATWVHGRVMKLAWSCQGKTSDASMGC